ncbi:regulatory protein RecX [Arcanobacterium haemolyticum]|uniref:Regulatory protein RecX n=1 Tax=Arcanobacterium haemolyticum (strain ATCC 9345 / DSM 20595 / CCM 5947 / CCUG 17215 / LMG 16163 / NBRC 15585 / NCTC 8452 / 11018) TaxID=644284 RepID=D7BN85_ARCHD|nr:regulatory protein RecX [Arcanobacterium haemolyticum]ADH92384.1 regulatory protein RecX [Arcanobacterium haemolyticum DSM 20595]QCX46519.1 regulatory protein RecX [Arcanobacterium haemolyticum]SPT75893.1 Regulatory protein recX [Arcanobacterium haemolyticum]SQH28888.1 Regulatory protein recX [Arcanobacterium haemolyticum]
MVNYAEDADFRPRKKAYRSAADIAKRKAERAAARTEEEWIQYAKDLCYRQLGMMERSVEQLRQSMVRNLVPEEIIESTLHAFEGAGLVDDSRFAHMFVRSKFAEKTISRRGLKEELKRRGIVDSLIEHALEQIDSHDEYEAARDFAVRKVRTMRGLEKDVIRRRLYGALARRGFNPDQIRNAVNSALESLEEEPE